jgi:dTDP-glucose 4,6-dehydratase
MDKVLITGAGGFIGSHLVEACIKRGYKVKALIRYNSKNDWGWLNDIRGKRHFEVVNGDIRDYDSVYHALKGCDTVFHLAALIGIPYSYISPLAYIKTNINGTYNVLQASRELLLRKIIITSTSETYGTARYVPIDEEHPISGQSPYAATKISADQLALSYYRSFDLPVKIVRPFNTYGPRQSARAIIPAVITQIMSGNNSIKLGSLHPTRDFTYVKDTVDGFIKIAESKFFFGEAVNLGRGDEVSMGDLVKIIALLMKKKIKIYAESKRIRPKKSEVERLVCDNSKLRKNIEWKPRYSFQKD